MLRQLLRLPQCVLLPLPPLRPAQLPRQQAREPTPLQARQPPSKQISHAAKHTACPLKPNAQGPQCAACRLPACTASSWRRLWRYTRRRWRISQPHRLWAWCRHTRRPWQQSHSTAGTEANFVSEETCGTSLRRAACQSGSQVRGAPRCSRQPQQPQQPQQQPAGRLLLACAEVHVEVADGALCVILVSLLPPHCLLAATRAPQACRHRKWNRHIHTACGLVNMRHAFLTCYSAQQNQQSGSKAAPLKP